MPAGWERNMASIKGRYEYSDELTPGQSKDGGLHQNLYDEQGNLVGHAVFIPDDEDEDDWLTSSPPLFCDHADEPNAEDEELAELQALLAALVLLGALKAVEKTAPHLRRWWRNQALPFIKSTRKKLARAHKAEGEAAEGETADGDVDDLIECLPSMLVDAPPESATESSREVVTALEEYRASMSSAEARERFVAALGARLLSEKARLFSEEQMAVLLNARIEDAELKSALETVTPEQVADNVKLMLETNPSLLDELGKITRAGQDEPRRLSNGKS